MAILNLTPDSFSDGSPCATLAENLAKAERLINDGADILDVGGESTRPGADPVTVSDEIQRVKPFVEAFRKRHPDFPISLDTKKAAVAREIAPFKIQIINDVSFLADPQLLKIAAENQCHYVLMHSRGDSQTMTKLTDYGDDVVSTIQREVREKTNLILNEYDFPRENLILDPGFGFAKTPAQCVALMQNLTVWREFEIPLLFAISRKRFLQYYVGECEARARDFISADLCLKAVQNGFGIIRTHNVKLTRSILSSRM